MSVSDEYVKFLTQKFVKYIDTPRSERKNAKVTRQESWPSRWFGMIPMSLKMMFNRHR